MEKLTRFLDAWAASLVVIIGALSAMALIIIIIWACVKALRLVPPLGILAVVILVGSLILAALTMEE